MGQLRSLIPQSGAVGGSVLVRCYAELNDFLPARWQHRDLVVGLGETATLGGLIAALCVPTAAVEIALINGCSSGLERPLRPGDRISLYPMFESLDVTPLLQLRAEPQRQVRFVADAHLGRLARYLRLLGFDTLYQNDLGDAALARISVRHRRILLSRDRALLARRILTHRLRVPMPRPREQLGYVVERLDLYCLFRPFTRCTICNTPLQKVAKDRADLPLPSRIKAQFNTFWICGGCGRIYWTGSHYERLRFLVERIAGARERPLGGG